MRTSNVYYLEDFLRESSQDLTQPKPIKVTSLDNLKLTKSQTRRLELIQIVLWNRLLSRLHTTIRVHQSVTHSHVVLLGTIEFRVCKESQQIECYVWQAGYGNYANIKRVQGRQVNIGLPLQFTKWIQTHLLQVVSEEFYAFVNLLREYNTAQTNFRSGVIWCSLETLLINWLNRHLISQLNWDRLRHVARDVINFNPQVMHLVYQSRLGAKSPIRLADYNSMLENRHIYEEVYRDNKKLLWLANLLINNRCEFHCNVIASMKKTMMGEGLAPAAWRLLCNSNKRDLEFILGGKNPYSDLILYLKVHQLLKRQHFIPKSLNHLFIHPHWGVEGEFVTYREVKFQPALFNKLIQEYTQAKNQTEISNQISAVIYWLKEFEPKIDHVQLKKPWQWFVSKASKVIKEKLMRTNSSKTTWNPIISQITVDGYQINAIDNLWQLMQLAVNQRHCIDTYGDACLQGKALVFNVVRAEKIVASILIRKYRLSWELDDVRGFANTKVSHEIENVSGVLAKLIKAKAIN